jgi:hypothetical protein
MRIAAVSFLFLLSWSITAAAQQEPVFQGKKASEWAERLADDATRPAADKILFENLPDVAPILPTLLRDSREIVKDTAVSLAGRCGPAAKESVLELRKLLGHANQYLRRKAAWALGEIGLAAAPVAPDLVPFLSRDEEQDRMTAANALWNLGPAGRDALVGAFRATPNDHLVAAMGCGGEKATPALVGLLDESDPALTEAASAALVLAGWTAIPALEKKGRSDLVERILKSMDRRYFTHRPEGMDLVTIPGPTADPGTIAVDWETNCEYRAAFAMYRFHWADGVLRGDRVRHPGFRSVDDLADAPVTTESATMAAPRARAMIRALLATTRVAIDRARQRREGKVFWCSTAHFYGRLFLEENGSGIYGAYYENQPGNKYGDTYVRLILAQGILKEGVDGLEWKVRPVSEDDLERLLRRTRSVSVEDHTPWEGIILLVRGIGDERFVPWLEKIIVQTEVEKRAYLAHAIDAYARITGVDYRTKPFTWKEAPAVRKRYLQHFAERNKAGSDR